MEQGVKWATELIDQKLAQEQEWERLQSQAPETPPVVARMDTPELQDEKRRGPVHRGIEGLKGQGRERRSSLDLRREIIGVGGLQYLIELRKTRRKRKEEKAAPEPELEPEESVGPVEEEAFLRAAVEGKLRVIEKFLGDGGSPDTCDEFHRTALHRASLEGHVEILQRLLERGAAVDFQDRLCQAPGRRGDANPGPLHLDSHQSQPGRPTRGCQCTFCPTLDCTALHWACRGGHLEAVKLLQDRGANLNLKDKLMSTPLHVATRTGQADIVEHLINAGVDVNSRDREGDSALHDAVRLNRYKIIKMLILFGADMMAQNLAGKTPTDLVQLWQADTRQALERQEPGETEAPV